MALQLSRFTERRVPQPVLLVTAIMVVLSLLAAFGAIALSGTKTGAVLALGTVLGPLAVYSSLVAPLVFPFSLFTLLVPFDNLLSISAAGTVTKLIAAVSALAVGLWLIRTRKAVAPDRAFLGWLTLVLWMVASLAWAMDPQFASIRVVTPLLLFGLYAVLSFYPADRKTLALLVMTTIVGAAIAGGYGSYVFAHGNDIRGGQRLFLANEDSFIDPNHFSAALLVPFCLGIVSFTHAREILPKIFYGACIALMGLGLAVAGSRGGTLGLLVAFIFLLIYSRKRVAIAVTGLAGIAVGLIFHGNVIMRFGNAASSGGAGRTEIWKVGIEAFRAHWFVGAGWGNFPLAFDQAYLRVSESYYTHWHRDSHNIFVGFSVELGVIGLIMLLVAWWLQFRTLRGVTQDDPIFPIRRALEAGMLGLFVCSFFLDTMGVKYVWLTFILIALARNASRVPSGGLGEIHVPTVLSSRTQR